MDEKGNSSEEYKRKLIRKQNELTLYEFGRHYSKRLCEEADRLAEEYKDLPLPKELDHWFEAYIKQLEKEARIKRWQSIGKKYATRAAAALLALLLTSAIVTMSVEAIRIRFMNFFIESGKDHNRVDFIDSSENIQKPGGWNNYYYPTWLPEGYTLLDAQSNDSTKVVIFINEENDLLIFTQNVNEMGMNMDGDYADAKVIPINDLEGYMTEKDGVISLTWSYQGMVFSLEGADDISVMIRISEKIEKVSE